MEVADAACSARVSRNNGSNKLPAALSRTAGVAMSATSLLFAWMAAGTLRRCSAMDGDEVFSGVLWGLSPVISAYLYSWTVALSPPPRANGHVFLRATCLLLLAAAVDKLIAPVAGAAAIVVAPLLPACACGRALAERLRRAGAEPWSAAAMSSTPTYQSRAEELDERERKVRAVSTMELMALVASASVGFMSWTEPETKWGDPPMEDVFFFAGPLLLIARLWQPCMVRNPVLAAIDDTLAMAAVFGVFGWLVVAVLARVVFGTIAGTLVVWMGELAMVGILGYFLAVEGHYKELIVIIRKQARRAKDASGLLDGRDSRDACSAHIDVDAGVDCVLPRWWQWLKTILLNSRSC